MLEIAIQYVRFALIREMLQRYSC